MGAWLTWPHTLLTLLCTVLQPMLTAAAFKSLNNPAWVVWSRRPRVGLDTIPTRSDERGKAVAGRGVLEDLSKDQARHTALTYQLCRWAQANLQLPLAEHSTGSSCT